jgi:arylsulfatase A-like enzyme
LEYFLNPTRHRIFAAMRASLTQLKTLFYRLFLALVLMCLLRIFFVCYNLSQLSNADTASWITIFLAGSLIDWIALFYGLMPVLVISWVEALAKNKKVLYYIGRIWFTVFFAFVIVISVVDILYFPYSKVRSGAELFEFTGDNNISIFTYLSSYFWAIPLILVLIWTAYRFYPQFKAVIVPVLRFSFIYIFTLGFLFLVARGGFRLRPLRSSDAVLFAPQGPWQAIPNTPLVVFESLGDEIYIPKLKPTEDFSSISKCDLQFFGDKPVQKMNVCIIILESFGKEYTGLNGGGARSYTPFLDSLMKVSLVFDQAYANGLKSMAVVPAIFASIPNLLDKHFVHSKYAGIRVDGLPGYLSKIGYTTAFFHGADKNTMGFRPFLLQIGLDKYYSKEDFKGDPTAFDGHWGLYDEPYFQYFAQELNHVPQPFMAGIFSLSSHHPYAVPQQYASAFEKGSLSIHPVIQYTDMALREFFKTASQMPWFSNTLFVITADHSSENSLAMFRTASGRYEVPLLFYCPKLNLNGISQKTAQHIDITPSILDLIHYPDSILSLGRSLLDSSVNIGAVHYDNGLYTYTKGQWSLQFDKKTALSLYDLQNDPACLTNLMSSKRLLADQLEKELRLQIANYNYRVTGSRMNR